MRVLVVAPDYPTGADPAAGIFVERQVQALIARGHDVAVTRIVPWAPPAGARKWARYRAVPADDIVDSVKVHAVRALVPPRMAGLALVAAQVASRIATDIVRQRAQLVHVHSLLPTARCVLGVNVPVVVTAHGTDAYETPWRRGDLRRGARLAIRSAAATVAVSSFVASHLAALGAIDPRVILNGADDAVFRLSSRAAARTELALPCDRKIIVFAGRLQHEKGIFDLASALDRLRPLAPLLYIAGDGPDKAEFERQLQSARIETRFAGVLSQSELARAFAAADLVTLPSHREGLPAVVCEAMLAGRAVVATSVGGIPEIVCDGVNGRLVPIHDADALARALGDVLSNTFVRDAFGREARNFAAQYLTWSRNAALYSDLYAEIAGDAVRPSSTPRSRASEIVQVR